MVLTRKSALVMTSALFPAVCRHNLSFLLVSCKLFVVCSVGRVHGDSSVLAFVFCFRLLMHAPSRGSQSRSCQVSYSPFLFLLFELVIVGTSLALHAYVHPYPDGDLNAAEFGTLLASVAAILCAMVVTLQPVDWTLNAGIDKPILVLLTMFLTCPLIGLVFLLMKEFTRRQVPPQGEPGPAKENSP